MNKKYSLISFVLPFIVCLIACKGNKLEKIASNGFDAFYKQVELLDEAKGDIDLFFSDVSYMGLSDKAKVEQIGETKYSDYIKNLNNFFTEDVIDRFMMERALPNLMYYTSGYKKADFKLQSLGKDGDYYKIKYSVKYSVKYSGDTNVVKDYEFKIKIENDKISFVEGPMGIN